MIINWTELIKYVLAMALAGGITGGGAFMERSNMMGQHQHDMGQLVQVLRVVEDCK